MKSYSRLNSTAFSVAFSFLIFVAIMMPLFVESQGIVRCDGPDCNLEELVELVQRIIDFLLVGLAIPLSIILFAYAGVLYVTAAGDTGRIEKGHKIFTAVLFGLVFALAAWLVVKILVAVLIGPDFDRSFLYINIF